MWFEYDGAFIRFTHTTTRAKYRNLQHNPAMSLLVVDPADPFRYLELRGSLQEVIPDPTGGYYVRLAKRYGEAAPEPPADRADRVILIMSIDRAVRR